jgi:large conductance mechanosensitive channel
MKGFRDFILRGNVVDLAIAVVIGAAFGAVVTALVKDLLTPLIAAVIGQTDFSAITFTVNNSKFLLGDFLNALISFLIIAAVVYFLVVLPVNRLMKRFKPEVAPAPETTHECPYCTSKISKAASRCPFCTSELAPSGEPLVHVR